MYSDVDECAEGTDTCDGRHYQTLTRHHQVFYRTRGVCVNTAGSFVCSCSKGFALEGSKCIGTVILNNMIRTMMIVCVIM